MCNTYVLTHKYLNTQCVYIYSIHNIYYVHYTCTYTHTCTGQYTITSEPLYYVHFGTLILVLITEVSSIQRSLNTLQYYTGTQNGVLIVEASAIQRLYREVPLYLHTCTYTNAHTHIHVCVMQIHFVQTSIYVCRWVCGCPGLHITICLVSKQLEYVSFLT